MKSEIKNLKELIAYYEDFDTSFLNVYERVVIEQRLIKYKEKLNRLENKQKKG